jgi:hypothetical protein
MGTAFKIWLLEFKIIIYTGNEEICYLHFIVVGIGKKNLGIGKLGHQIDFK